jgi:transcriptional antiterminator NusG
MSKPGKKQRERARRQRRVERRAAQRSLGTQPNMGAALGTSAADPVRGGASSFIDPALRWHMIKTAPLLGPLGRRCLDDALRQRDVRAFRPRASEIVVRRGRRVVRHTPLLVKTIIIGVKDQDHLDAVVGLPGVAEAVTYTAVDTENEGNIPGLVRRVARLDPQALQRFFNALAEGEIVKPVGVEVGSNVVVMVGPFASFPATVEAILPNDRLKVAVSIFGRPSPVELGIADVTLV